MIQGRELQGTLTANVSQADKSLRQQESTSLGPGEVSRILLTKT